MKNKLQKALGILLCVCLCAGLIPASAALADTDGAGADTPAIGESESFDAARGVVISASSFPDPVFRAYVAENCDTDGDLVLTDEEIEAVTEMDVHGLGIADLGGIWAFQNLVRLNCSENRLRELDVSDLPNLTELYCQDNYVTETTVEGEDGETTSYVGLERLYPSRSLRVLWCYNNSLSAEGLILDLCPELEYLNCSNNPLGALNLASVPRLLELRCNNCGLNALDLSHTPELCVLWCWTDYINTGYYKVLAMNSITYIDLTPCPKLAAAVAYGVRENYIMHAAFFDGESEVSVSTMSLNGDAITLNLGEEYGGEFVVKEDGSNSSDTLEVLFPDPNFRAYVAETIDTDHDGSLSYDERSAVETIDCGGREIASLEGISAFWNLTVLNCADNALTELNLSQNYNLTALYCENNRLTQLSIDYNSELRMLRCYHNQLTELDLSKNGELAFLLCTDNRLTSLHVDACPALVECVHFGEASSTDTYRVYTLAEDGESGTGAAANAATPAPAAVRSMLALDIGVDLDTGIVIDEEHFPDEAFRELVSSFDTDGSGYLSKIEIEAVTEINCSGTQENPGSIADLRGIEYFTSAASLDCSYNALTAIELGNSPRLTRLTCSGNPLVSLDVSPYPQLTSLRCDNCGLTSLNVSGLAALTSLYCENNLLSALDLSSNTALTALNCSGNRLATLELGGNRKLTTLNCSRNGLQTLDLSACGLLTSLDCSGNSIPELDISACEFLQTAYTKGELQTELDYPTYIYRQDVMITYAFGFQTQPYQMVYRLTVDNAYTVSMDDRMAALAAMFPDNNLRRYVIDNLDTDQDGRLSQQEINSVTELNISNLGIADLTGIGVFRELTVLNCSGNMLTALDVSSLPKLEELYCQNNNIYGTIKDLYSGGEYKPIVIYLPEAQTEDEEALRAAVAAKLLEDSASGGLIGSDAETFDAPATEGGIEGLTLGSSPLRVLWCYDNRLTALDLDPSDTLENLDCAYNLLDALDVSGMPNLTTLMCHDNNLTSLDLSANPKLVTLWCWNNPMESLDISPCPRLVAAAGRSIERFNDHVSLFDSEAEVSLSLYTALYKGGAVDEGIPLTAANFPDREFRAFVRVSVDRNYDGVLSDAEIAAADYLDCTGWGIGSLEGVNYLTGLKFLRCRLNHLTEVDVSGLELLEELDCSYNQISSLNVGGAAALRRLRVVGNQLGELDLSNNRRLSVLWCWYNALEELDLSGCPILAELAESGITERYGGESTGYYDDEGEYHEQGTTPVYISYFDKAGISDLSVDETTVLKTERFVAVSGENFPDQAFRAFVGETLDEDQDGFLNRAEIGIVTEINCAGREIADLTGIEYFGALEILNCSENSLTTLDISALSALRELDCSHNSLTAFDTGRNPALLMINCAWNSLNDVVFSNHYYLQSLDCSHNPLTAIDLTDCDTVSWFLRSGVSPTTENGVRTWNDVFRREDGEIISAFFCCDASAQLTLTPYPEPDCVLPAELRSIESEAFVNTVFTCVGVCENVKTIGARAFADSPSLRYLYILSANVEIADDAFENVRPLTIIGMPGSTAETYAKARGIAFALLSTDAIPAAVPVLLPSEIIAG